MRGLRVGPRTRIAYFDLVRPWPTDPDGANGRLLNQLPVWAPDAATRKAILTDNPARLYQF